LLSAPASFFGLVSSAITGAAAKTAQSMSALSDREISLFISNFLSKQFEKAT
jgi:hypothetical protein